MTTKPFPSIFSFESSNSKKLVWLPLPLQLSIFVLHNNSASYIIMKNGCVKFKHTLQPSMHTQNTWQKKIICIREQRSSIHITFMTECIRGKSESSSQRFASQEGCAIREQTKISLVFLSSHTFALPSAIFLFIRALTKIQEWRTISYTYMAAYYYDIVGGLYYIIKTDLHSYQNKMLLIRSTQPQTLSRSFVAGTLSLRCVYQAQYMVSLLLFLPLSQLHSTFLRSGHLSRLLVRMKHQ